MSWRAATVTAVRDETPTARTLVLRVPGWPGHVAGQHVDIRLTAPDGYTATRSYSIASASAGAGARDGGAGDGLRPDGGVGEDVEVTVERLDDGEVSPYLAGEVVPGDVLEVRGPVGGWFVWRAGTAGPVQLVAGGSGLVPLMAMIRTRARAGDRTPMRLLHSVRDPAAALYRDELHRLAAASDGLEVSYAYTRTAPAGEARAPGRVDAALLADRTWPADGAPACYVCGPTGFVETVADLLVAAGHDTARIRTERFGPTGGPR